MNLLCGLQSGSFQMDDRWHEGRISDWAELSSGMVGKDYGSIPGWMKRRSRHRLVSPSADLIMEEPGDVASKVFPFTGTVFLPLCAWAQTTIPQEYDKLIQQRGEVVAFGADGFGDKVELSNGALEIVQVDVDLPGNNSLPVRGARRFVPGNKHAVGHFGVWNLDVPYVHGVFGYHAYNPQGWTVNQVTADMYKRCSRYGPPLTLVFQQIGVFEPDEYWHGNFLHMPGQGDEELLLASGHAPNDGNTYPIVTKSGAAVRCVALAPTSEAGSQGGGVRGGGCRWNRIHLEPDGEPDGGEHLQAHRSEGAAYQSFTHHGVLRYPAVGCGQFRFAEKGGSAVPDSHNGPVRQQRDLFMEYDEPLAIAEHLGK